VVLTGAAACWYAGEVAPRQVVHLLEALALGVGVLAACAMNPWDGGTWLSYHVLTLAWALTALLTMAAGTWALVRPPDVSAPRSGWSAARDESASWVP